MASVQIDNNVQTTVDAQSSRNRGLVATAPDFNLIYLWTFIGFMFVALNVYVFTRWITGPYFKTVPIGPDVPPQWLLLFVRFLEFLSPVCFVLVAYKVIFKPWRRTGRLSGDALIVLACITFYWQNNGVNYFTHTVFLNSIFHNWGSWYMYIPGWMSPNMQNMPEAPFVWMLCFATWFVFFPMVLGARLMGKIKERFPRLTGWQLFSCIWLVFMGFDFVLEGTFLRTGIYAYATTIPALTIWPGQLYQFPIYEIVGWGGGWALIASNYYYRDDKGMTFVERGVQRLKVGGRMQGLVRFLAMAAFINLMMLFTSTIPVALGGLLGGPMVEGYPSYLNTKICGPGTAYLCPGPRVTVPKQTTPTNRIPQQTPPGS